VNDALWSARVDPQAAGRWVSRLAVFGGGAAWSSPVRRPARLQGQVQAAALIDPLPAKKAEPQAAALADASLS